MLHVSPPYKLKVVQIGPVSYVGGVSMHINRLANLIKGFFLFTYVDESPIKFTKKNTLNIRKLKDIIKIINQIKSTDLVHIHSGNWVLRIYVIIFVWLLNKRFIITLHSYRLSYLQRSLTSIFLQKASCIVAVSLEIKEMLPRRLRNRIITKEAFIPPSLDKEELLPKDVLGVVQRYKRDNTLICANAFRLTSFENRELYGFDQCIDIALQAKKNRQNLHLLFVIATIKKDDQNYYNEFLNLINSNSLNNYITIIPKSISFISLIKECDIVLRPTLSDGDALTIREALWLNKNVIASDIVKRPHGTILYKTGDSKDLFNKIVQLKNNKPFINVDDSSSILKSYLSFYTKLYLKCNN